MKLNSTTSSRLVSTCRPNRVLAKALTPCIATSLLVLMTGCTSMRLPKLDTLMKNPLALNAPESADYTGPEGQAMTGMAMGKTSVAEQVYHGTKQARAKNGVVLQIVGDETPIRVLPMPEGGQSVYVSQLLTQSGVVQQLGSVEATLFRHSTHSIGGVPMECKMTTDGRTVRPESDYALQPGDRLRVAKANPFGSTNLVDLVLRR